MNDGHYEIVVKLMPVDSLEKMRTIRFCQEVLLRMFVFSFDLEALWTVTRIIPKMCIRRHLLTKNQVKHQCRQCPIGHWQQWNWQHFHILTAGLSTVALAEVEASAKVVDNTQHDWMIAVMHPLCKRKVLNHDKANFNGVVLGNSQHRLSRGCDKRRMGHCELFGCLVVVVHKPVEKAKGSGNR